MTRGRSAPTGPGATPATPDRPPAPAAREATRRLAGLSAPELRRVRAFERRHRNRKTVLRAVERRLG